MSILPYRKRIQFFVANSDFQSKLSNEAKVLVVGCGRGHEALCLHTMNPTLHVISLDIALGTNNPVTDQIEFVCADACNLPFRNDSLDFCYCFHVLEHIDNYSLSLAEMARALKSDGELYLSTPNRQRLILYVQSAQVEPFATIVRRNLREWIARLKGEFLPEKGYHCGFSMTDLHHALTISFRKIRIVSELYALHLASGTVYLPLVKLLSRVRVLKVIAPSHTVYCQMPRKSAAS